MTSMAIDQSQLRAALLDPTQAVPTGLTDGAGKPTQKRFDVYRNNVTVALRDALRTGFPVLCKLLGDQRFDQLATLFARAHPPKTPLMMHYGDEMPKFLAEFSPLAHIGYLADVARLELAMRRAYHAADAHPIAPEELRSLAPEQLLTATLTLAPAVQIIASDWPLFDIWQFNMIMGAAKPRAIKQSVLITRLAFDPQPHPLDVAQAAWIMAVHDGATVENAQEAALSIDPEFDLGPLLGLLFQQGALAKITPSKD